MAGEALKDANFEARSRLSNDPEEAERRAGLVGDNYDVSGYSDKEISMALMGSSFGDKDYSRLTGESMDDSGENDSPTPGTSPAPEPSPSPGKTPMINPIMPSPVAPLPGIDSPGSGSMNQNIIQDNDISNTINGDNNEVSNFQDNSISQSMGSSDYSARYARGLKDKYLLNLINR